MEVVYLDFAKAYDKVDHHLLLMKMRTIGICGNIGKWLGSFLLKRTQQVKVGDKLSTSKEVVSGVPQGSVLGPIMFLIFVQNMGQKSDAKGLIYADDAKVAKAVKDESDILSFQNDLERYYEWAKANNMEFNCSKFVALRYGRNDTLKSETSYFTNEWI